MLTETVFRINAFPATQKALGKQPAWWPETFTQSQKHLGWMLIWRPLEVI